MWRARLWRNRLFHAMRVVLVFLAVAVVVTVAAAARSSRHVAMDVVPATTTTTTVDVNARQAALERSITFAPGPGATDVPPDTSVIVVARAGRLMSVHVTGSDGREHFGAFAPGEQWHTRDRLAYGTSYTVRAVVSDGTVDVERAARFRTIQPAGGVTASVFPNRGLTVGVGQPVVVRLSRGIYDPAARAALLDHVKVTVARPVRGGWHWFSPRELHFRPQALWPAGEKVTVAWDLSAWRSGDGGWGIGSGSTHFTVGPARVSFVDLAAHTMTVTVNTVPVAVFPISGGRPKDPTMGGMHVVLDREHVVHMVSSTVGIPVDSPDGYDELVYDDVHISDSGEYVHAAPWSVTSQGRTNVSHGCVNLSPTDAHAFFEFSRIGDVVIVDGSPRPPEFGDHGVMDWSTAWTSFTPAHVASAARPHFAERIFRR